MPTTKAELAERRARARDSRRRKRLRLAALVPLAILGLVLGVRAGADHGNTDGVASGDAAGPPSELPGGGRQIIPAHRVVAFYGAPQDTELGALGIGGPREAGRALLRQARQYRNLGKPVLPAFELIADLATADPGPSGHYNLRQTKGTIRRYLGAARHDHALLILDIQPGTADFMNEVQALAPFLKQPDVSLALDPEWHIAPGEIPGQVIGSVDAGTVNDVSAYLSGIVRRNRLPQKLLVIHQFTDDMITDRGTLEANPGVALTLNADGFGDRPNKVSKYRSLRPASDGLDVIAFSGFKLFYSEDVGLMSPPSVLRLRPEPDLIIYE